MCICIHICPTYVQVKKTFGLEKVLSSNQFAFCENPVRVLFLVRQKLITCTYTRLVRNSDPYNSQARRSTEIP